MIAPKPIGQIRVYLSRAMRKKFGSFIRNDWETLKGILTKQKETDIHRRRRPRASGPPCRLRIPLLQQFFTSVKSGSSKAP